MKNLQRTKLTLPILLFALEGCLLQFATSINSFANNLYATNLGATEKEIGLIQSIPNFLACLILLPLGILADRLRSAKTIPIIMLIINGLAFLGFATVPVMGTKKMLFFFFFLAFSVGCLVIYNAQWQSFFGKVTPIEERNDVLAIRNKAMFIIGVIIPVICGMMMGQKSSAEGKIGVLRVFFYLSGIFILVQTFVVARIPEASIEKVSTASFSIREIGDTIINVFKNQQLRLFFFPVMLFYATWQLDWSMWYLGQIVYCQLSETAISVSNGVFNIGQLIMIGIMAKIVWKKSPDYAFVFAAVGLACCPLLIMFTSICPLGSRGIVYTILMTVLNSPQCAVGLCVVQMLLKATPENNRGFIISLFTLMTTLTNSFMPFLGVQYYLWLGGGTKAFYGFNVTLFILRVITIGVLVWRYKRIKQINL